jgi:LmbE family N-acetylglucosaminyl deacetylase
VKPFALSSGMEAAGTILCLGAHSDDLEIGCGGTILHLIRTNPNLTVHWVVFSAGGERAREASAGAEQFLKGAKSKKVVLKEFRDGFMPYTGAQVKEFFETLKGDVTPDLIFTHTRHDLHQDHRLICELTWNTYRRHTILEYEVPKYDGDLGSPNLFVPLSDEIVQQKIDILRSVFATQRGKHWFDEELFRSLMRIRGMECASGRYAEAFYSRKLVLA